jgi:IS30 family transposase
MITVGTGTIYAEIYCGELGVDPVKVFRRGHAKRLRRNVLCPNTSHSPLGDCLSIDVRPAHIAKRVEHGHWEGDLVRHEALLNRAVMKGHRLLFVAADS